MNEISINQKSPERSSDLKETSNILVIQGEEDKMTA